MDSRNLSPVGHLQVMLLKKAVTKFKTAITDGESSTGNDSVAGGGGGNRNYSALSNKSGLRERVLNGGGGGGAVLANNIDISG